MTQFSIITPVLNDERFIARAVDSVIGQTEVSIEYLIQDGGSTDSTLDRIGELPVGCRVASVADRGPAEALNRAIKQSSGELIGWLNADDCYPEQVLQRVAEYFDARPDCDILYGVTQHIDEDGDPLTLRQPRHFSARRLRQRNILPAAGIFFRRRVVETVGPLDDRFRFWFDYDFWLRAARQRLRFCRTSHVLAYRRIHPGNTRSGALSPDEQWRIARERLELFAAKHGPPPIRFVWDYALHTASLAGANPECDPRFDAIVLSAARDAEDEFVPLGHRTARRRLTLYATHLRRTITGLIRRPHEAARWLPGPLRNVAHVHARRRVFRLRHHSPRPLRVVIPPPEQQPRSTPRISLVTPNYNGAPFLAATIRSVLAQDYPNLEYIVQDGGSTDGSQAIALGFADQLASFRSQRDRGQAQAINRGFARATGEILGWINSDDLLMPGALRTVAAFFEQRPDVDVVYGNRLLIDARGRDIGRWVLPPYDDGLIAFADYIPQETMFWRRRAWEAVGECLDESFQFAMDWDLILRFRAAGMRFHRIPQFLGAFRVTDAQKTIQLIHTIGMREMKRLRVRHLGRNPSDREIRNRLSPFLRRHWLYDKLLAAREQLTQPLTQEVCYESTTPASVPFTQQRAA